MDDTFSAHISVKTVSQSSRMILFSWSLLEVFFFKHPKVVPFDSSQETHLARSKLSLFCFVFCVYYLQSVLSHRHVEEFPFCQASSDWELSFHLAF